MLSNSQALPCPSMYSKLQLCVCPSTSGLGGIPSASISCCFLVSCVDSVFFWHKSRARNSPHRSRLSTPPGPRTTEAGTSLTVVLSPRTKCTVGQVQQLQPHSKEPSTASRDQARKFLLHAEISVEMTPSHKVSHSK